MTIDQVSFVDIYLDVVVLILTEYMIATGNAIILSYLHLFGLRVKEEREWKDKKIFLSNCVLLTKLSWR